VTVRDGGPEPALPVPADDEVALLLQTVWDLLVAGEHWPPYRAVDRLLYRDRQIDVDTVIARTPQTLLVGGRPAGGAQPPPEGQLALTAAGAAACLGSGPALAVFLAAARLAADAELQTPPDGDDPSVTFQDAAAAAGVPAVGDESKRVARQSGLLLHAEPWSGHLMLYEGGWKMTVDRRARPYAGVEDLAAYWQLRERQHQPDPADLRTPPPAPLPAPTAPTSDGEGRVVQLSRQWVLGPRLGSGGFGAVFAATDEDGTSAAAKFVPKVPGAERELLFAQLDGVRNVVPVIDSGEDDESWVLVMPRARHSLADVVADAGGPLPLDEALTVLRDVATALADLAARPDGVVHRDIKPGNVLLLDGGWCLADFGISRYAEASTAPDTRKLAMSPPYAAPERWNVERATARTDVYAVGVMAFELLTGAYPFPGPGWEEFRDQHLHHEPPALPSAPPRLAALVGECLQKPPGARPTPEALLARLQRARGAELQGGAGDLAAAYQQQVGHSAADGAAASRARSEEQRRASLAAAASRSLNTIAERLLSVVLDAAPVQVQRRPEMSWIVELGSTKFGLSAPTPFDGRSWGGWEGPPFDVVASATVTVVIPTDRHGYEGRSHSLYYCDAQQEGSYAWFETAFMADPLSSVHTGQDPFALPPGEQAAKALWPGLAEYHVAWPVTELVLGDLDEFVDRWVGWFAAGVQGRLSHPSRMPERPVDGTWRRR
jgi:serine/threonine-protein kinase